MGTCGDGSPILVVTDSTDSSNALNFGQYFVSEILRTEGLLEFSESALTDLDSTCIASHDVVILPSLVLTSGQATLFSDYVDGGGFLIGLRPDHQLASTFNVTPESGHFCGYNGYEQDAGPVTAPTKTVCADAAAIVPGTAAECTDDALPSGKSCAWGMTTWIALDTTHPVAAGLESHTMKVHGAAKKYSLGTGTQQVARFYSDASTATAFPAVTYYLHGGGGRAALFAYDLAESVVTTRQGNPWLAGHNLSITQAESKGNRAAQMFVDQRTSPPSSWNATLHGYAAVDRNTIPQADEQMHVLTNLIMSAATLRPLPRSWYHDNGKRAVLSFSSDGCVGSGATEAAIREDVRVRGGNMAFYGFGFRSNTEVLETWQTPGGDEVSIHFNSEGCPPNSDVSPILYGNMKIGTENLLSDFSYAYGLTPKTSRNHCLTWASLGPSAELDPVAQARIFSGTTIELDNSYSTFPNSFGYMTGSALPMRFVDSCGDNKVTSVYQLATQFEDDVQGGTASYSLGWHSAAQVVKYTEALSANFRRYHGIMNPLFHGGDWNNSFKMSSSGVPLLDHARALGIPIVPPRIVNAVWAARRALHFDNVAYSAGALTFTATDATQGQTVLLPARFGTQALASVTLDSTPATVAVEVFHGVAYGRVVLPSSGNVAVAADYAPAHSIIGSVGATAAAVTRVNLTGYATANNSLMINQTTRPDANGDYRFDGLWPGSYAVSATSDLYQFSPLAQDVAVANADVVQDFASSAGALPLGAGYSLHTAEVPAIDPASATPLEGSYELGMRFTPAVSGVVTHLKFWKTAADQNSTIGRTATLWDATSHARLASVTWSHAEELGLEGWLQKALPGPIAVTANVTYVVSVNSKSNYVHTPGAFDVPIVNRSLTSDISTYAGVYNTTAGSYPSSYSTASDLFRDVVFVPRDVAVFTTQTPSATNGSGSYELGMKFTLDVDGEVKGIRYWRAPGESTSGHIGKIWSSTGTQLASVAFASETACPSGYASGCWQQLTLSTPVALDAGTYVVSVNTQSNKYVYTTNGLASAIDNGPIHAVGGSNGVYSTTPGAFPTTSYNNSNYFRDVIFEPGRSRTLVTPSTVPSTNYNDTSYELGTIIYSDVPGYISALRFYKSALFDGGVHVGKVWNSGGQILAAVVFENETALGWQQQTLPEPLLIAPGVRYTVSVNTGHDARKTCATSTECSAGSGLCTGGVCEPKYGYVATPGFFSSQVSAGHLHSETSAAGVYGPIGTLPTTTYNNNGYFRDVVFVPN